MDALVDIFVRNEIPQTIISNNGAQLTGKMMTDFCSTYGIQKIETAPYRQQSNSLVERFHGTLIPLLKKCSNNKSDWVKLLTMALYVIRLTPNSPTGVSPYPLVHGRDLHSPVDLLYNGWVEQRMEQTDVTRWAEEMAEIIDLLRESAALQQMKTTEIRKEKYNRNARERIFSKGDKVLI